MSGVRVYGIVWFVVLIVGIRVLSFSSYHYYHYYCAATHEAVPHGAPLMDPHELYGPPHKPLTDPLTNPPHALMSLTDPCAPAHMLAYPIPHTLTHTLWPASHLPHTGLSALPATCPTRV